MPVRAENPSVDAYLQAALSPDQRRNVLFPSFTQWDFALAALADKPFSMVVTDLRMDPMDGLTLLGQIRSLHPGLPVRLMTAFGDVPSYMEAVEKGAVEYLFKPFRMEEMKAAIARALGPDVESRA